MKTRPTFAIETLGCKVNQYESEALGDLLVKRGWRQAEAGETPDLAVVNTCSVTHLADRKSRQAVRRFARMVPKPRLAVIGCYSQIDAEVLAEMEGVDWIRGSYDKGALVEWLTEPPEKACRVEIKSLEVYRPFDGLALTDLGERTRGMVKIQDGCDNYCAYCIIPYTRGRSRSRPLPAILEEARALASKGFRELVLIGIQSAFYGRDLPDRIELVDVVEAVAGIEGIDRVRLGSAEPTYFTRRRLERLTSVKAFCPHFHLSLQSGSDRILKAMNRKYTTAEYKTVVDDIRALFERPAVTTDLIVGFPGETDEDFEETLSFVEGIAFSGIHVFRYSKRKGTAAAGRDFQVPASVAKERSEAAMALSHKAAGVFLEKQVGRIENVLFERFTSEDIQEGLTCRHVPVRVEGRTPLAGSLKPVRLERAGDGFIWGEVVS